MFEVDINPVSALKKAFAAALPQLKPVKANGEKLLKKTANKSHEILFRANNVFPFNFFPDTVIVDREKLTLVNRFFFRVAKITSVPIRDIQSVEADIGPFFGSVYMTSRYFFTNPRSINFLWRRDAIELQRLLQGYIIVTEQNIDCAGIKRQPLIEMLEDLGQSNEKRKLFAR